MARFSLFPDSPSMRQVFSARSIRYRWRSGDPVVTVTIVIVCVAVWLVEFVFSYVWKGGLNAMLQFGMLQPAVAVREPWTFVTSMFLHDPRSIFHIGFNMLTLWCVGPFLERLMGHWEYLMLYMLSGIGGNAAMVAWAALTGSSNPYNWFTSCYGASGALFGLFAGCLVVYRKMHEDLRSMLIWMGINFLMPLVIPDIAWQAHLGGFIVGGLATMLVVDGLPPLRRRSVMTRMVVYGLALFVLLVLVVLFSNMANPLRLL
ncbi:MAG: rhomboid family intramembrane serine protease [Bifidobacterium sp.]|nr:rhomboid family intramembrane serine protease [Bifidobacterium sp.]